MPKVSIIIPSYNHGRFLKDRLDSINNQTFQDWELIIIDDCSTDTSLEILEKFVENNKSKISHFIVNESNSGSGYFSWQKGIELSKSKYIWIAETDDYSEHNFLEEQIAILEKDKNISLVFCVSNYVDEDKKHLYYSIDRTKDLGVNENHFGVFCSDKFNEKMPFNTYITNGSSVVFRKPKEKLPDEIFNNKQSSDIFLWTHLIENKSFAFLNKKLNFFRRHKDSTTIKMIIFDQKKIYIETIKYLNFFKQTHKFEIFLEHYLNHYVYFNKNEIFKTKVLREINNVSYVKIKYYAFLLKVTIQKIMKKIWS